MRRIVTLCGVWVAVCVGLLFLSSSSRGQGGEIKGKAPDSSVAGWRWGGQNNSDPEFFKANDDGTLVGAKGSGFLKQPGGVTKFEVEMWIPSTTVPGGWVKEHTIEGDINGPNNGEYFFTFTTAKAEKTLPKDVVVTFEAYVTVQAGPNPQRTWVATKSEKATP
jgi:hypothetical protein